MSTPEGAGDYPVFPNLDFVIDPEVRYDPERIAEVTLWPFVNDTWRGDFRKDGEPGLPAYAIALAGEYGNAWYEVGLEAETETDEWLTKEGESKAKVQIIVHKLSLYIEKLTPHEVGNMVDLAIRENSEPVMEMLQEDGEGISREHEIRAYEGVYYVFDSDGDCHIEPYIVLKNAHKKELWTKGWETAPDDNIDDEDDSGEEKPEQVLTDPKFFEQDVDNLIIALNILRGDTNAIKYLQMIKAYPERQKTRE